MKPWKADPRHGGAIQVASSRKSTKSRTHGRKGHSTGAEASTRVHAPRADLEKQLRRELAEAREEQTATSEVLRVISSSPGELKPVFQAMLENATRICEAKFGILFRYEGGVFHPAAMANVPAAFADFLDRQGLRPCAAGCLAALLRQKKLFTSLTGRLSQRRALRSGMVARDLQ
jgi:hypothetical protein